MSVLIELQEAVAAVAVAAGPSVVGIGSRLRGSGVVIAEGRVLTNAHNLRGPEVTVRFADGRTARGTATGVDWDGDLAVVEVDIWRARPRLGLRRGNHRVRGLRGGGDAGRWGLRLVRLRVLRGARVPSPGGRRISGSVEHTAPLAPGSSGSPLVDADGALIALNTNRVGEGFYLALPADASLGPGWTPCQRRSPERPHLGIAVAPARVARRLRRSVGLPERDGLLVRGVEDGSPAANAGIAEGDLLVAASGRPVDDVDALHEALRDTGFPLEVTLVRGTEERSVTVTAPDRGGDVDVDAGAPAGPIH